jgi:hypothetical protein
MGSRSMTSRKVEIERHEGERAVSKLMNGKAAGEDGIRNEIVNSSGLVILEWLIRLSTLSMSMDNVLLDWRCAIVFLSFKSNGDRRNAFKECLLLRGSLPSKIKKKSKYVLLV